MAVNSSIRKAFGKRVVTLREERELTQLELGKKVGVSGTCIWNWEGGNTFPRSGALKKLAQALGTTVEYLTSAVGPATSSDSNGPQLQSLADVITAAREAIADAGGVPISKVHIAIRYTD